MGFSFVKSIIEWYLVISLFFLSLVWIGIISIPSPLSFLSFVYKSLHKAFVQPYRLEYLKKSVSWLVADTTNRERWEPRNFLFTLLWHDESWPLFRGKGFNKKGKKGDLKKSLISTLHCWHNLLLALIQLPTSFLCSIVMIFNDWIMIEWNRSFSFQWKLPNWKKAYEKSWVNE